MNHGQNISFFRFWKQYASIIRLRILNTQVPTWYILRKFGLTPGKFIHRLFPVAGSPLVLLICIPKSGTNLLERAICLHPRLYRKLLPVITPIHLAKQNNMSALLKCIKPGQVVLSHLTYTPNRAAEVVASGVKTIMMVRDPRDIAVSRAFYATRLLGHQCRGAFLVQPDLKSKIELSIIGDNNLGVDPIRQRLEEFSDWLGIVDYVVRFEDLIGSRGGGSDERQKNTIKGIYKAIGLEVSDRLREDIRLSIFSSSSPTFHKGLVGQWRDCFDHELETLFMSQAGDLLKKFGYT